MMKSWYSYRTLIVDSCHSYSWYKVAYIWPRLNSSAYLQAVGFEVAASADTFTTLFWIFIDNKQLLI